MSDKLFDFKKITMETVALEENEKFFTTERRQTKYSQYLSFPQQYLISLHKT